MSELSEENVERILSETDPDAVRVDPSKRVVGVLPIKFRESRAVLHWEWPRGAKRRGLGLRRDTVWFYEEVPSTTRQSVQYLSATMGEGVGGMSDEMRVGSKIYAYDRTVGREARKYLSRWMLYLPGGWILRLHKFWSGDDDCAPHDHPFGFWTLPLRTYYETVEEPELYGFREALRYTNKVRRFRIHYRPATYRHIVLEPERPFFSIVLAKMTRPVRKWGFWRRDGVFIPHDAVSTYDELLRN